MKAWKSTAALMIAVASLVGCDKGEEKTPVTPPPAPKTESAVDKFNNAVGTVTDSAKQKGAEAGATMKETAGAAQDKAIEMKDATAAKATDMKDSASAAATDAKAAIVETAQKYYDQAKGYLASNNLTSASDMITKLDGIKSQLPAEWQTKVDDLKAMYDKAKAGVGNMMPKMGN